MIFDNIKNSGKYLTFCPELKKAFEFLETVTENVESGRYEIDADNYVNVFSYETKSRDDALFENHSLYADIHFVIEGTEQIDISSAEHCALVRDNYTSDDSALLTSDGHFSTLELRKGDFAVVFPGEAHRPGIETGNGRGKVLKAVVKCKVSLLFSDGRNGGFD